MTLYLTDHFAIENVNAVFPNFFLRVRKAHIDYVKNIIRKYNVVLSLSSNELVDMIRRALGVKNITNVENYEARAGDLIIYFGNEIYIIEIIERMV